MPINPYILNPRIKHELPKHSGWRAWCSLCCELRLYVNELTGMDVPWMPSELKPREELNVGVVKRGIISGDTSGLNSHPQPILAGGGDVTGLLSGSSEFNI